MDSLRAGTRRAAHASAGPFTAIGDAGPVGGYDPNVVHRPSETT